MGGTDLGKATCGPQTALLKLCPDAFRRRRSCASRWLRSSVAPATLPEGFLWLQEILVLPRGPESYSPKKQS